MPVPRAIPPEVTICITSCGRLNLLAETLATFRAHNTGGVYHLSDDSADPAVAAEIRRLYPEMHCHFSDTRGGLMRSIDRLYSGVTTPYLFHLEDDWAFSGPVDWSSAIVLLSTRPAIANISVRAFEEIKPKWRAKSDPLSFDGQQYRIMHAASHPEFFGWSPNPGLIRTALYHVHAPFARYLPDQLSGIIKAAGGTMAYQLPGVARHIGHGRNAPDPTMPARPRSKIAKFIRKIKKDLYYLGLRRDPF